jgi:2'-5' RNA ligase
MIIGGLGAFPNVRRPRVIWVGTEAPPELNALQRAIEAETHKLGYPIEERPFSPHLTLGRISQNARPEEVTQVARALSMVNIGEIGRVHVGQLHLFRSDLRPSGAVYTSLYSFPLR